MKRTILGLALTVMATAATVPATVSAAAYPDKPIRMVVPYPPGGTSDVLGRLLGQQMADKLGQPVIIENRPGAAEAVGATLTAKAPADGYTLMLATLSSLAVNPSLYGETLAYNPTTDFAPIVHLASVPSIIAVNPSVPAKNMEELRAHLRSGGEHSYASPGVGAPGHLGMELLKRDAGLDVLHIPYKGGAPALQALMGGQVELMMALVPEVMPLAEAGKLRPLAITTLERSALYPDIPTASESGFKDFEIFLWYTMVAPAGTPDDVVLKLNQTLNDILKDPKTRAQLDKLSIDAAGGTPQDAKALIESESAKWKTVIEGANIKPE